MRLLFVFLSSILVLTACSHTQKNVLSDDENSNLEKNSSADCRALNEINNTLYPLKRVGNTQRFETQVDDVRVAVTMEDPFVLFHNSESMVVRWHYFILSPNAKFETFRQENYLAKGRGSFGEFLAMFSSHRPPDFEQHIATFQSEGGTRLRLYCMTTVIDGSSKKIISLKKDDGRYYRSSH